MAIVALVAAAFLRSASAYPKYAGSDPTSNSNGNAAPPCPLVGGPRRGLAEDEDGSDPLATANAQRDARVKEWGYPVGPAMDGPHKYQVGVANEGEMYCEADGATRWCDTIHGRWGDSIPRTDEHCIWGVLEFQDPPEFGWGGENSNSTAFSGMFDSAGQSLTTGGFDEHVLLYTGTGGSPTGQIYDAPWAVAMIVWKRGNEFAKPWIADFHRPVEQTAGYEWGWTLRAHYKAFNCSELKPAVDAYNVVEGEYAPDAFARLWNAYMDVTDISGDFFLGETCSIGPCQAADADANTNATDAIKGNGSYGVDGDDVEDASSSCQSLGPNFITIAASTTVVTGLVLAVTQAF